MKWIDRPSAKEMNKRPSATEMDEIENHILVPVTNILVNFIFNNNFISKHIKPKPVSAVYKNKIQHLM